MVHFTQGNSFAKSTHSQTLLEKKLKQCFLPEKITPLLLSNFKMIEESDNKFTTNEKIKLERHKAFYESFRIVQPKGLKIKEVNEKKYREKQILLEDSANEKQSCSAKEEFNENDEFSIKEENEQKYEYADIFSDANILKLLKNCFFGIKNYNQNGFILNIMSQKNNMQGFYLINNIIQSF